MEVMGMVHLLSFRFKKKKFLTQYYYKLLKILGWYLLGLCCLNEIIFSFILKYQRISNINNKFVKLDES